MRNFSLRSLLYLIAFVPLSAFLWLSISSVRESFNRYTNLESQLVVQRLANVGAAIAQNMPAEGLAAPQELQDRRTATDSAFLALKKAYQDWKAYGNADAGIDAAANFILEGQNRLNTFRSRIDTKTATPTEGVMVLQPIAANGLALMDRSSATISDIDLSRFIAGYHALMQVNDGYLIEFAIGKQYASNQPLDMQDLGYTAHARELKRIFGIPLRAFLPADIVTPLESFEKSEQGKLLNALVNDMTTNTPTSVTPSQIDAAGKAGAILRAELIVKAGTALNAAAEKRKSELYADFIRGSIVALVVTILVVILCLLVMRTVSAIIRVIETRMGKLADGETQAPIPFATRKDEFGGIARSVEVFRQSAIRNKQLEAEAEHNRQRSEAERAEVQRRAEADAEERLNKATGALASGLRQLADGDMNCEIHEQFAPQFEALRQDFNISVKQLRDVLISVGNSASAVQAGSGEISQAADNLARRTEQQAASLEETAAALEEITTNVKSTSKRTNEARDLVKEARSNAGQSSTVVGNAVSAMERIEQASIQISQIIGVIDEIAFQTNLLALN
ncbi:methyl-accepting chemotaxis protein, partial [Rhizobium sp.]|uniref:methyl-accepting chemotaxis protein n=1 Tax=Rhizobium sp. TaxID=391 RepID=UPI002AA85CDA